MDERLRQAIYANDVMEIQKLIDQGVNISVPKSNDMLPLEMSPILEAVRLRRISAVTVLAKKIPKDLQYAINFLHGMVSNHSWKKYNKYFDR